PDCPPASRGPQGANAPLAMRLGTWGRSCARAPISGLVFSGLQTFVSYKCLTCASPSRFAPHIVIPGRRGAANPESSGCGARFRVRDLVAPRNDKVPAMASDQTRSAILAAAERLYADRGFGDVTLRDIVAEANVNLAAVNYHFGSKDELIAELFVTRSIAGNRERLNELRAAEESGGGRASIDAILH